MEENGNTLTRLPQPLQDSAGVGRILQDSAGFCKILQDSAGFCGILQDSGGKVVDAVARPPFFFVSACNSLDSLNLR